MKYALLLLSCLAILSTRLPAQKNIQLKSPDGNIVFSLSTQNNTAVYKVAYRGKTIIEASPLGLQFESFEISTNIKFGKAVYHDSVEDYDLVLGKTKHVHIQFKELDITIQTLNPPLRQIVLETRAFNDGLAFRYKILQQSIYTAFGLLDEKTSFHIAGDPIVHCLFLPNYTSSHEGYYSTLPLSKIVEDTLMDMPTLFELPGNIYLGITEAALLDYAGMYLSKHDNAIVSKLSPLPNDHGIKVVGKFPHVSPWRVMLISNRVGALIESNIITSLNEPCKIKDLSWIRPGKTTFPWWNGNVLPDTINAPGNNFVTAKYYIDFCARNNLQYHSVVEYGLHQWYTDDGVNFQPGPHSDVTTPVPGLDMKEICDYAAKLGVGIRVWVHWAALYPKLDSAFALFEKWGLKGMMVDFMDRDDQDMVNIQTEMLQKAAAHHLHIQFHGAYKPTGVNRTYPNEYTREGTLNYEADKWTDEGLSPDHDINIPFTRMLAGSTDYHLGGFRAAPPSKFRAQYTRPLVLGTRCHMLAMYVVLENYLQMVCDYPEAYEGQEGFEFIKEIPTTWDETKVPDAKVGEYITIARRSNEDWYVGTINNHNAREITIPLSFLSNGTYAATIYSDAQNNDQDPNHLVKQTKTVTNKDVLKIQLAAGGGEVVHFRKSGEQADKLNK